MEATGVFEAALAVVDVLVLDERVENKAEGLDVVAEGFFDGLGGFLARFSVARNHHVENFRVRGGFCRRRTSKRSLAEVSSNMRTQAGTPVTARFVQHFFHFVGQLIGTEGSAAGRETACSARYRFCFSAFPRGSCPPSLLMPSRKNSRPVEMSFGALHDALVQLARFGVVQFRRAVRVRVVVEAARGLQEAVHIPPAHRRKPRARGPPAPPGTVLLKSRSRAGRLQQPLLDILFNGFFHKIRINPRPEERRGNGGRF